MYEARTRRTRGAREASMMLKFSIFQLSVTITSLFVVACTASASNERADCTLKKEWYPAGSSLLFGGLLGSIPLSWSGLWTTSLHACSYE